jgi:hypothetical protein
MMAVDSSVLDLARVQPVADPAAWLHPLRVLSLHGQVGDSVSEVRPVQRTEGETAIERVH